MMERNRHHCQAAGFKSAFIKLYLDCDLSLFRSKNLQLAKITKASTAKRSLEAFIQEVCSHKVCEEEEESIRQIKVEEVP